jgi:hypothetical protein
MLARVEQDLQNFTKINKVMDLKDECACKYNNIQ